MFLKSLELEGFKSFVDTTRLEFNNGFTAIVGPNGCGKSNVSDAIRWVIGEQSLKSLRGKGITDLIFNGSQSRKPVHRTEISLTLAHVPPGIRIANVPNLSEEVKITRCYHRSGESEFYINQVPCRLKDITDFLLDIGISPKVLTVIEQGHIQDVITSKPEDRRIYIEEAAGILKFKHRRNEALRKLDSSRQNLERINDIVKELKRQVESLKRQASKADRYKRFQGEVKQLSLKLFAKKHREYQAQLQVIETEYRQLTEQKAQKTARASTLENQINSLDLEIAESARELSEKKDQVQELAQRISSDEHNIELKKSQINQAKGDIKGASEEIVKMNEEIATLAAEMENQRRQLGTVSEEINELEITLSRHKEGFDQDKESQRQIEEQVKAGEKQILTLYQRLAQKKNDLTGLGARMEFLQHRGNTLQQEQEKTENQAEQIRQSLGQAQADHDRKVQHFSSLKEQHEIIRKQVSECQNQLQSQTQHLESLKEEYLTQSSLLASWKELRKKLEGFQDGIKSLMSYNANGGHLEGLREVLVDVLKTPRKYERAVETVLGDKLQSIIVNSYSDSIEAISYLKDHQSGRGSFIPMQADPLPPTPVYLNGNPNILGKAMDFIECKTEYRPVIELLLGNVVVAKDLDTAIQFRQNSKFCGTVVSLNGEMIDAQGLVTGGAVKDDSTGLLAKNRQIEELTAKVGQLRYELDLVEAENGRQKHKLAGMETDIKQIELTVHETEITKTNSQKDVEQMQKELDRLEEKKSTLEYEMASGRHELKEMTLQQTTLNNEMKAGEQEKDREEARLNELRLDLQRRREELETKSNEINSHQVEIASLIGKRENTGTEIKRLELQQENLGQRIQKREDEKLNNSKKIREIEQAVEQLERHILELAREKDRLVEEVVQDEESLQEKEENLKQMDQETKDLFKQIQGLTESISKVELKQSEANIQMIHLAEKAYDDFNVALEEMLAAYDEEIDVPETEEQIRELKEKLLKMGEVNLAALSEFQQTNERFTFLQKQTVDLEESILTLHQTIEKINRTTKQTFLDTFQQVNENFQEIFARLFQGGKARLQLCEESNPLESGIEIIANPLGKQMQNLTLLSGGEKAMTAIALIFSVFKVRPSPFCLLDEVDAPLDEANVVRFQEMLKEMAIQTQFIIITHNQKTMSFADVLYGITMEEQGISKAVSVTLN